MPNPDAKVQRKKYSQHDEAAFLEILRQDELRHLYKMLRDSPKETVEVIVQGSALYHRRTPKAVRGRKRPRAIGFPDNFQEDDNES